MRKKINLRKHVKQIPWIMISCIMAGGGLIFARESIRMGFYVIDLLHMEKLP